MKKSNSQLAVLIISGIAIGATLGWILFPTKRKKIVSKLKFESSAISDSVKLRLNSFMSSIRKELEQAFDNANDYLGVEKALNAKILAITSTLRNDFPELYSFIEEMPVTIPETNDPEINIQHLKKYYQSLEIMLENYVRSLKEKKVIA